MKKLAKASVRLRDIADEAKLSVTAVSLALKDSSEIAAGTRARVRRLAQRMGYVTPIERRRWSKPSGYKRFGLLLVGARPQGDTAHALLHGTSSAALRVRGRMEYLSIPSSTDPTAVVAQAVTFARDLQGILIYGFTDRYLLEGLARAEVPYLVLGNTSVLPGEIPAELIHVVTHDHVSMGWFATQALIRRGHKRIGFVCATMPPRMYNFSWYAGYRHAHIEATLPIDASLCYIGPAGDAAVEAMLTLRSRPTGYVLSDANEATKFLDALRRRDALPPKDAFVIGATRGQPERLELSDYPLVLSNEEQIAEIGLLALHGASDGTPLFRGTLQVPFSTLNLAEP